MEERESQPMLDDSMPRAVSSAEPYRFDGRRPRPTLVLKTVSPEVLAKYLALPETQKAVSKLVRSLIAKDTPTPVLEDIEQEAYVAALSAQSRPRSPETMKAWLKTLVRRAVCNYFRTAKRDKTWLERDEDVEEQPADPVDPLEDPWLVHDWLKSAVAGDDLDAETFELLTYRARTGKTDREVAEDHGLTYAAWTNRLSRFKKKYVERYERRRMVLLLLGGAVVALLVVVVAVVLRALFAPTPPVSPRSRALEPAPTPTPEPAPAPTPTPFNAAGGTDAGFLERESKPRRP
jgi:DNA-directed RNA polymerase specialized sigma24 family protein